jgi:hypothetical protein
MNERQVLQTLRAEMHAELTGRILPYWTVTAADPRNGGFIGLITEEGVADTAAPKGGILNARILWAFSAAHRVLGGDTCREAAERTSSGPDSWIGPTAGSTGPSTRPVRRTTRGSTSMPRRSASTR